MIFFFLLSKVFFANGFRHSFELRIGKFTLQTLCVMFIFYDYSSIIIFFFNANICDLYLSQIEDENSFDSKFF